MTARRVAAALVMLAVVSLAGCGSDTTSVTAGAAPAGSATSEEPSGSPSGPDLELLGQGHLEGPVVIYFWSGY